MRTHHLIKALTWNVNGTDPGTTDAKELERIQYVVKKAWHGLGDGDLLAVGLQETIDPTALLSRDSVAQRRTNQWANHFSKSDNVQVLQHGEVHHHSGVSLILLSKGPPSFTVVGEEPTVVIHETGALFGTARKATIGVRLQDSSKRVLTLSVSHLPAYSYWYGIVKERDGKEARKRALEMRDKAIADAYCKIHQDSQNIIWIGDMNYRLEEGADCTEKRGEGDWPFERASEQDIANVMKYCDTLTEGMSLENRNAFRPQVLMFLRESRVRFPPTYKMNEHHWPGKEGVAWTDRILFLSNDKTLNPVPGTYDSIPPWKHLAIVSDHAPVVENFSWLITCKACGLPVRATTNGF